jgi:hypothetical protein
MNAAPESVFCSGALVLAMMKGARENSLGCLFSFSNQSRLFFLQPEGRILRFYPAAVGISEMQKGFWFLKRGMKIDIMRVH